METPISLRNIYEAIISDCKKIIENNVEKAYVKDIEENIGSDIEKLINLYINIIQSSKVKGNMRAYSLEYLNAMAKDIKENKSVEVTEEEIYRAYGYLFSFCYINELSYVILMLIL